MVERRRSGKSAKIKIRRGAGKRGDGENVAFKRFDRNMLKNIGQKIDKQLSSQDKTTEWLGNRAKVARSTLREIVGGRSNPRILTLNAIAQALGYRNLVEFLRDV